MRLTSLAVRALIPTLVASGVVLLARVAEGDRTLGVAIAEVVLFTGTFALTTWLRERPLLVEMLGYLRNRAGAAAPVPAP